MTVLAMPQFWMTVVTVLGASLIVLARQERANQTSCTRRSLQTKARFPVPSHQKD
jgi:hypothetical protein